MLLGFVAKAGIRRSFATKSVPLQHQYQNMWSWHRFVHRIPDDGSVIHLQNSWNGAEVYLVGSCHVSEKSALLVKQVIDIMHPNIIAVELCKRRAKSLLSVKRLPNDQPSFLQLILNSWQFPGSPLKKLLHFFLASQYQSLRAIGLEPGKEFEVAVKECKRLQAQLCLIDEEIEVTIAKLIDALSFSVILRLFKAGKRIQEIIGKVELIDAIDMFSERNFARKLVNIFKSECPEIARVLITHRDKVMFEHLRKCEGKIVGLVGMGHMDGIEQMWKNIEKIQSKDNH